MKEIALLLAQMGNEVKYTQRQDGGIRITYINGQRFTGSTGNAIAREIVGATISEARVKQLSKIRTPKGKWGHKKLDPVSEEVKKEIRKVQRLYKKLGTKAGMPTLRKYRAILKEYGHEEAQRRLRQASRYAMGYAYEENVYHLAERISMDAKALQSDRLAVIALKILHIRDRFLEKWIQQILQWLYDMENGRYQPDEVADMINELVR